MELKLRQRLVGAVVIIALAVIFIPMFFKGANPTAPNKVALNAPLPTDSAKASTANAPQIILNDQSNSPTKNTTQQSQPQVSTVNQSQAIATNQAAILGTSNSTGAAKVVANPNQLAFGNETLPVPTAATTTNTKSKHVQKVAPTTTVTTTTVATTEEAVDTSSDDDVTTPVQKPAAKVKKPVKPKPVIAATQKAQSSAATPAQQLAFAQQAVQAEIANAAASEGLPTANAWVVQLGSFSSDANAKKLVTELRAKGFTVFTRVIKVSNNSMVKVFVGPEVRRTKADALQTKLNHDLHVKGVVVAFDPLQVK